MVTLETELAVNGISGLEVLLHVHGNNLNQPKSLFKQ